MKYDGTRIARKADMKKRKFNDGGMFREGMPVPQDIDGASAPMKKPISKPGVAMKKPIHAPKKPLMPTVPKPRGAMSDESMTLGMKKGGAVGSASKRGDGIAVKGKTKGAQVAC